MPTWFFPIPPWEASRCCPECERRIYHDEPGFELDGPCEECVEQGGGQAHES